VGDNYKRFVINTTDGSIVSNEDNEQQIMAAFAIGPDKRLYFGTIGTVQADGGKIQAVDIGAGLETGSWSVRGGDLQGTNRQRAAQQYQITFDGNGGTSPASQTVNHGDLVTRPADPVRSGYTFVQWNNGSVLWNFSLDVVTENLTLTAQWTSLPTHIVSFAGESVQLDPCNVIEGDTVVRPADPTRTGYVFSGWYTNDAPYDFHTPVTAAFTLTARWTANTYTVTFAGDGISGIPPQTVEHGIPAVRPSPDPAREGYTFNGWYNGEAEWNFATAITAPITLTAQWQINTYTVTFAGDGISNIPPQTVEHGIPAVRPSPDPAREGYTFNGWYNGEIEWNFATAITAPITLTAKWTSSSTAVSTTTAEALNVYPNPATDRLTIANNQRKAGSKIEVYTISGSLVAVHKVSAGSETTISIAALPAGTYVVKLGNRVAKVVVK
jgi:uncharacterized repeat protein (TIGR02543 family)